MTPEVAYNPLCRPWSRIFYSPQWLLRGSLMSTCSRVPLYCWRIKLVYLTAPCKLFASAPWINLNCPPQSPSTSLQVLFISHSVLEDQWPVLYTSPQYTRCAKTSPGPSSALVTDLYQTRYRPPPQSENISPTYQYIHLVRLSLVFFDF